ncbi:GntR family transcriptional regulator [Pedococcus sp. 5OH_020]|uniref:GntR family transcriptional regulator n=1 Tax=Pedococcus sp. 5OH_020 TaxID=2989814 RepID=UPI0022E9C53A|nr:GntR family transcriptional regulator [Pedococcus sp. 5OH_020]
MSSLVQPARPEPSARAKSNGGKSERVRRHVLQTIDAGLGPHDRLPTERELAEQLGVSRLTVQRVLDDLTTENRIYRIQGSGTFVRPTRIAKSMELTSFSEDMRSRRMAPGSLEISVTQEPAGANLAALLELSPGSPVVSIRRVRTADGAPICLERSQLPAELVPGLSAEDVSGSLYELLAERYGIQIDRADQTIRATVLDPDDASDLEVPAYSAAFEVDRLAVDHRGRPVEHAVSLYRADRYSYQLTVAVAKRHGTG